MNLSRAKKPTAVALCLALGCQGAFAAQESKLSEVPKLVQGLFLPKSGKTKFPAQGREGFPHEVINHPQPLRTEELPVAKPPAPKPVVQAELADAASVSPRLEKGEIPDEQSRVLAARPFAFFRPAGDAALPVFSRWAGRSASLLRRAAKAGSAKSGAPAPAEMPPKPEASLGRSLRAGLIGGGCYGALSYAPILIGLAAGYRFHWNYHAPDAGAFFGTHPSPLHVAAYLPRYFLLMPTAEETFFRAGLMGGLVWVMSKLGSSPALRFWIPAIVSSAAFVAVHETSDPLLIAFRLAGSLVLARVFYKEGLIPSAVAHIFSNFSMVAFSVAKAGLGLEAAFWAGLSALALEAGALSAAAASLWRERWDRRAEPQALYSLPPRAAAYLAILFVAATLMEPIKLLGLLIYHAAALGLLAYAAFSRRAGKS